MMMMDMNHDISYLRLIFYYYYYHFSSKHIQFLHFFFYFPLRYLPFRLDCFIMNGVTFSLFCLVLFCFSLNYSIMGRM